LKQQKEDYKVRLTFRITDKTLAQGECMNSEVRTIRDNFEAKNPKLIGGYYSYKILEI
jgi:hypothetical protein